MSDDEDRFDTIHMTVPMPALAARHGAAVLDRYVLVDKLGAGGMGEVWSAKDPRVSDRMVAVKFLNLHGTPDQRETLKARFLAEADLMASLRSRNVVRILDRGEAPDGRMVIVMDYLAGSPLDEVIETRAPLSVEETLRILREVAEALEEAHAKGLVHRDLKPANIFLEQVLHGSEQVRLLDFGIAKKLDESGDAQSLTAAGTIVGTPEYMAPEQLFSESRAESDLYALGVLAYECLTGSRPLQGSLPQLMRMHQGGVLPPPMDPKLRVPPEVQLLVDHLLVKNPEQRMRSARDLRLEIERIMNRRFGRTGRFTPKAPTGARLPVIVATAASAVAVMALGYSVLRDRSEPPRRPAVAPEPRIAVTGPTGRLRVEVQPPQAASRLKLNPPSPLKDPDARLAELRSGEAASLPVGRYELVVPAQGRCEALVQPIQVEAETAVETRLTVDCRPSSAYEARTTSGRIPALEQLEEAAAVAATECARADRLRLRFRPGGRLYVRPRAAGSCMRKKLASWRTKVGRAVDITLTRR